MPEITVTADQRERLEDLREHIAREHVGPYGHVRMREVVQFLLDRYGEAGGDAGGEPGERETVRWVVERRLADRPYQELQSLAAETDGVEPGGKAEDLRARLVEARVEELLAARDGDRGDGATGPDGRTEVDDPGADDGDAGGGNTEDGANGAGKGTDRREAGGDDASDGESDDASDGGGPRLQRMMGLLDRHDDRWSEADAEDGKYAVTLPDGSVETVRTRDDVRALLFEHYD